MDFSSHRGTSIGEVSLSIRIRVACVCKHRKLKIYSKEHVPGSGGEQEDGNGGGKMQESDLEERFQEQSQETQTGI